MNKARNDPKRHASAERVGKVIGDGYRLTKLLGEGGMSAVYEAVRGEDRPSVAIKLLHSGLSEDRDAVMRLQREAEVLSTISHPNICRIIDVGQTRSGSPFLVMERLVGQSLAEQFKQHGPMHFNELAVYLKQVLSGLEIAHQRGVLHRDLKPDNIFIVRHQPGQKAVAKILDFGIATHLHLQPDDDRLTQSGMVMGTPFYMAPEQARGENRIDHRTDLWALGVILYEGLMGRRPFVANNYNALLVQILAGTPPAVGRDGDPLWQAVEELLNRAMARDLRERFQSARAFAIAIEQVESLGSESTSTPSMWTRSEDMDQPVPSEITEVMPRRRLDETLDELGGRGRKSPLRPKQGGDSSS